MDNKFWFNISLSHSILITFQKGHILFWSHSILTAFYHSKKGTSQKEDIPKKDFSILSIFRFKCIPKRADSRRAYSDLITFHFEQSPKRAHSKKSIFHLKHILTRVHSILITFQEEKIHEKSTFQKYHIPKIAYFKKDTFHFEHIPKRTLSKNSTFQKGYIWKKFDNFKNYIHSKILYILGTLTTQAKPSACMVQLAWQIYKLVCFWGCLKNRLYALNVSLTQYPRVVRLPSCRQSKGSGISSCKKPMLFTKIATF